MWKSLAPLVIVCAALVTIPAAAQSPGILYDNGTPCPGRCWDGWQINLGGVVTDSFFLNTNSRVTGFDFWTWEFPGDRVLRVQWSVTSDPFGGTVFGSGYTLATDKFIAMNEYGFDVDRVTVTGINIALPRGTYWLTLQNAVDEQRYPVYWDENSGSFCRSPGCPSSADDNLVGTIPSETFDIRGVHQPGTDDQSSAPKSGSSILWGPVLIGAIEVLRRFIV